MLLIKTVSLRHALWGCSGGPRVCVPCAGFYLDSTPSGGVGVSCLPESSRDHACIMGEHSMQYRKSFQVSSLWQVSFSVLLLVTE